MPPLSPVQARTTVTQVIPGLWLINNLNTCQQPPVRQRFAAHASYVYVMHLFLSGLIFNKSK